MLPRLRRALWWHLAGLAYGLGCRVMDVGGWAMGHVEGARPSAECLERMRARAAQGWRHGLTVAPLTDEDVTAGVGGMLMPYVAMNAQYGMHGMAPVGDTDGEQDA